LAENQWDVSLAAVDSRAGAQRNDCEVCVKGWKPVLGFWTKFLFWVAVLFLVFRFAFTQNQSIILAVVVALGVDTTRYLSARSNQEREFTPMHIAVRFDFALLQSLGFWDGTEQGAEVIRNQQPSDGGVIRRGINITVIGSDKEGEPNICFFSDHKFFKSTMKIEEPLGLKLPTEFTWTWEPRFYFGRIGSHGVSPNERRYGYAVGVVLNSDWWEKREPNLKSLVVGKIQTDHNTGQTYLPLAVIPRIELMNEYNTEVDGWQKTRTEILGQFGWKCEDVSIPEIRVYERRVRSNFVTVSSNQLG
jgi:hypothetical protein